jgi:hypothetical protein
LVPIIQSFAPSDIDVTRIMQLLNKHHWQV